ncbi:DNA-binding CsgD family transcriptional regulator [Pseudarthrobacter oxydans]|uniref:helix-turn-helix transcriptional regulator n=1 Tax=Pseudarthrobacter oxydans TaxID=1671 RepID=UPI00278B68CE|nr:LuxR C-terminal-related transcriptional regulator [Pseudarthrobacter oxydans]MDP9983566.1 DNA-binding CsgD family transcriptional regulator [Pseudarthrobacter oxydans]
MSTLADGREAYAERRWPDAVGQYTAADHDAELPAGDLEQLATSVILTGRGSEGVDILARAHLKYLADCDYTAAARCAVWTGLNLILLGEPARGAGWLARAHRIVEDLPEPCPFEGLLSVPVGLAALYQGDGATAAASFTRAADLGRARGDADSAALGTLGLGQAKVLLGEFDAGLALLDEAMVAVTVGEISPVPAGIIYCAVIETCHLAFDLHRAHEWTRALDRWCDAQQKLVAFSGQCQMHRAELYRLHGAWAEAIDAAKTAQDFAYRGDRMAIYGGFYEQGEIHRLRGDFDAAEACYLHAQETGFPPQPGLALLRLAQGRPEQAQSLLRQAMDGIDPAYRRRMLAARVEIELAAGDAPAARAAVEELAALCAAVDMPLLHALAEQSEAALLFHDGDPAAALVPLRRAWSRWLGLDAPFEAARCRALLARLCAALGDEESARLEREAARAVFAELGAAPALAGLEQPLPAAPDARTAPSRTAAARTTPAPTGHDAQHAADAGPLTARETEVVRLVSAGLSNRTIAAELFISEKTVARHLSNIFTKLGLTSRAAVTAYAYQHGLA